MSQVSLFMERSDFIKTKDDIIRNIMTLYSYLKGELGDEYKNWAIDKMVRGKNFVVEVIDSKICFAPSRFVGYIDNSKDKHDENHGDGTQTDEKIKIYYNKIQDERLDLLLQNELLKYGASSGEKKYWIAKDATVDDIIRVLKTKSQHIPYNIEYDKYWHIQMHLPEGKGGTQIDSTLMLLESEPVIGTGEWNDSQCKNFKSIENGNIILVRKGSQAIALCQVIGDNLQMKSLLKNISMLILEK